VAIEWLGWLFGVACAGGGFVMLRRERSAAAARLAAAQRVEQDLQRELARRKDEVVASTAAAEAMAARHRATVALSQGVLDALPFPVWRRDADLRLVDCNKVYAEMLGVEREAAIKESSRLGGQAVEERLGALARLVQRTRTAQTETHHVVVAGSRRLMEITKTPLSDSGILGVAIDVTDRDEIHAELARHIAAHGQVLENLGTAIAIYGADRRLAFFNTAFERLWKLERSLLETKPDYGAVLETLRERRRVQEHVNFPLFKKQQLALFTSLLDPVEELTYIPDGTTLRTRIWPHPMGGLLFTYEDVTDVLALERSYNTLNAVQRETLDNLYEGVAVLGGDLRLKLTNPAYRRIWQLPPEFAEEAHIADILERGRELYDDEGDWPGFQERMLAEMTERTPQSGRIVRRDGVVLEHARVPLPDGALLLSYIDVTDSTRVERALRERTEALEAADRLKTEFISNVSYELRTPLNTISGFAEILANQYFGPLNERQREYCAGIMTSSERLLTIINDILDLASLEAGRLTLERETVELRPLLDGVARLMEEWARSRLLALTVEGADDLGAIEADERRIRQALANLVSNAIKFTQPGGRIVIRGAIEGEEAVLSVSDTGVGIMPDDQERVFREFERAQIGEGRGGGAGLGLALVKRFVELHGGRVAIESEPGQGTTVICRLPVREPKAA
jgi:signal transduction histidine kinase